MSYSVLICDDEPLVCDLLCNLLDWEALGFQIIGIVNDGQSALMRIKHDNPDVVITDIRMPLLNGLDLIRETRAAGIASEFIVISGYKSFDYAYEAINFGVSRYLLKPIQESELASALISIRTDKANSEAYMDSLHDFKAAMDENFMQMLLHGQLLKKTVAQINEQFKLNLRDGYFCFALFQFDDIYIRKNTDISRINSVLKIARDIVMHILSQFCCAILCVEDSCRLVVLLNFNEKNKFSRTLCMKIIGKVKEQLNVSNYYALTMAIGKTEDRCENLSELLSSARDVLKTRLVYGCDRLLMYEPLEYIAPESLFDKQQWRDLINGLERLDEQAIKASLEQYFQQVEKLAEQYPTLPYDATEYMSKLLTMQRMKLGISLPSIQTRTSVKDWKYAMISRKMLEQQIVEYFTTYIAEYRGNRQSSDIVPVERAKAYIAAHIGDTLSLETVSEHIHLNPIYFSALFRKTTGVNFLAYVTEMRIERSKDLLLETDYTIATVAEKVGYYDSKYFSKTFKKQTGISPQQYRRLHGKR